MKNTGKLILIGMAFVGVMAGCSPDSEQGLQIFNAPFDFSDGLQGWDADFTDYPAETDVEDDSVYEWNFTYTTLPPYLGSRNAIMLSSNNRSGDLFMFIKKKITDLKPNTEYSLVFEVELASNALNGQGIVLKAGASDVEPKKVIEENEYSLNIDKGSSLTGGEDIIALGEIGTGPGSNEFVLNTKSNASAYDPFVVRTNSNGELWIIIGTDSNYQGVTTVYYTKVNVIFSR